MGKITVVHIITKLELGGAQQNTLFTVNHLDRTAFDVVLISSSEGILIEEALKLSTVTVHLIPELVREIGPLKDLKALFKIKTILKRLKRDQQKESRENTGDIIVHTHCSKAGILGRWAAYLAGIRCIVHSYHGFSFNVFQPALLSAFYIFLERITSIITTKFIMVSKANIEKGIQKKIFVRDKVVLIRSGIDIEKFQNAGSTIKTRRKELAVSDDIPLIAMIACLKLQKAPLDFVKVANSVLQYTNEAHFVLVGDGVLRPEVEKLIRQLGLDNKIVLLGWRRDIPEIMKCINVLVLTSLWEGVPRVLPQAMSLGIPIVATEVDGTPEAVHNGVNGFVLPPGDIEGIAKKIIYLITHPEKARDMGEKGKQLVNEFDIWKMMNQQEQLYVELSQLNAH
jgi:glycosyltransferase involved in cell wall biosynthesis